MGNISKQFKPMFIQEVDNGIESFCSHANVGMFFTFIFEIHDHFAVEEKFGYRSPAK